MMNLDDIMSSVTLARTVKAPRCVIFEFASGPVRIWEGVGDLIAGAYTWKGIGDLGSIEGSIELGPGLPTQLVTMKLSLKATMLAAALANQSGECRGRICQLGIIPIGKRNDDGTPVIGAEWQAATDPWIYRSYIMDTLDVEFDRETMTGQALLQIIPITADKHFAPGGNLSGTDQQTRYPGDTGLDRRALYRTGMTIIF